MYQPGEKIIYSSSGVCTVEAVCVPPFAGKNERDRLYYRLSPRGGTETIYVPVDSGAFMRPVMTREEAERLIGRMPDIPERVCTTRSVTMLRQQYEAVLKAHDCESCVGLIKGLHAKEKGGGRLGQTDQRYRKRAEELLCGELAAALELEPEAVPGYIRARLGE